jgi:hypothetical protein
MAKPTNSPVLPVMSRACKAKKGKTKNKPNIRAANKPASAKLAWRSVGVKDNDWVSDIKL